MQVVPLLTQLLSFPMNYSCIQVYNSGIGCGMGVEGKNVVESCVVRWPMTGEEVSGGGVPAMANVVATARQPTKLRRRHLSAGEFNNGGPNDSGQTD